MLFDIGCIAFEFCAIFMDRPEREGRFVNFCTILVATAGKDHGKIFLLHKNLHCSRLQTSSACLGKDRPSFFYSRE